MLARTEQGILYLNLLYEALLTVVAQQRGAQNPLPPQANDASPHSTDHRQAPFSVPPHVSLVSANAFKRSAKQGEVYTFRLTGRADDRPPLASFAATKAEDQSSSPPTDSKDPSVLVPSEYHEFLDVFSKATADELPSRRPYDHHIPIAEGAKIPTSRIYPLSASELETLAKYIEDNMRSGFIRQSSSPVGAPILFVKKKDGSLRLCVDYRALNSVTVKNKYPLPLIGETLDRLSQAKYFTKLDLRNGYHQIRIAEGDEWKTAFRTRYGHYEYQVMPFGLTNAPATFQNMINDTYMEYLDDFVVVYLDDILIFSNTLEEHKRHVRLALQKLRDNHLFAKAEKCSFHAAEVEYLGYLVGPSGIRMDPSKLESIRTWPLPRCLKEVQSFLGFCNFYRRFIYRYSQLATPLTSLTKKDVKFNMGEEQVQAFEALKQAFVDADILRHFEPNVQCIIETDASDFGIGAAISQRINGKLHPIAFFSRKLNPAELNYDIFDKELLAVVSAFKHWRPYLEGAPEQTLVFTDHMNLLPFQTHKVLNRRQMRWHLFMAPFNYKIEHRAGKLQGRSDALSRRADYYEGSRASDSAPIRFFEPHQIGAITKDPFPTLLDELLAAQDEDPAIRQVLQDLRLGENLESHDKRWSFDENALLLWDNLIYVPDDPHTRLRVIRDVHDSPTAGHPGVARTMERFSRTYYFPQARQFIHNYVNTCDECHRSKPVRKKAHGLLHPLEAPDAPFLSLSMDFIVKLPPAPSGNDSIFVVVDRFSKFAYFIPCREEGLTSPVVARLFHRFVLANHGLPDEIVSDRGSVFTGEFWRTLNDLLGTQLNMSTAFHPQTDGQTERTNQTLEQYLRLYCNYQQDNWEDLLPLAQFVYNDSKHSATKTTPFRAVFGRDPALRLVPLGKSKSSDASAQEFASRMRVMHQVMRGELQQTAARMKASFDKKIAEAPIFELGDRVWLSARNVVTRRRCKKLDHKFLGPFAVQERVGDCAYRLKLPAEVKLHPVFHVSLLHRYSENTIPDRIPPPPPITIVDGEEEHEVEQILESQTRNGNLRYRVRWRGLPPSEDEWVDANDVHAPELIAEYHAQNPKAQALPPGRQSSRLKKR